MYKKLLSTALLASLPMLSLQAESNLTKADPFESFFKDDPFFKDFQKIQEDMNRAFENMHKRAFINMPDISNHGFSMKLKTDVTDKGDYYEVLVDIPNMDKAKLEVTAKDGILSISAQSQSRKEQKEGDKVIRQERFIGSFSRSMTLPKDADEAKMNTEYKDGVLKVTIGKNSP